MTERTLEASRGNLEETSTELSEACPEPASLNPRIKSHVTCLLLKIAAGQTETGIDATTTEELNQEATALAQLLLQLNYRELQDDFQAAKELYKKGWHFIVGTNPPVLQYPKKRSAGYARYTLQPEDAEDMFAYHDGHIETRVERDIPEPLWKREVAMYLLDLSLELADADRL